MKLLGLVVLALIGSVLTESETNRIAGGSQASVGQYPFMAGIQQLFDGTWWEYNCGGTLLTRVIVLSSARFLGRAANTPRSWRVRLGSNRASSGGTLHSVSRITIHPEHNNFNNDLSIFRLASPAVYSNTIRAGRIAGPNYELRDGTTVHAAGFGPNMVARAPSEILLRVNMPIVNHRTCTERYASLSSYPNVSNRMICSGGQNAGTCGADSGGPVVHGSDVIVGVISFSYGCGVRGYPSVHSRVSYYSRWISSFQ